MIDLHGRSILLGAIIIFIYNILFSIFSMFVANIYYKTVFLMFSILSNAVGLLFLVIVYFKLYNIVRDILDEDEGLKEILTSKQSDDVEDDVNCTFPHCERHKCSWEGFVEDCPTYIKENKMFPDEYLLEKNKEK